MTDTIADLLVRIKNAYLAHHEQVILPSSKIKLAIAQVLQEAGYLLEVKEEANQKGQKNLILQLSRTGRIFRGPDSAGGGHHARGAGAGQGRALPSEEHQKIGRAHV